MFYLGRLPTFAHSSGRLRLFSTYRKNQLASSRPLIQSNHNAKHSILIRCKYSRCELANGFCEEWKRGFSSNRLLGYSWSNIQVIALTWVFPTAIVLTTESRFHVKRTYVSIRGLVVRTIALGKTRISAITFYSVPPKKRFPLKSGASSPCSDLNTLTP